MLFLVQKIYLGIAARDLAAEQGVQQALLLLKHIRLDQDLSTLLRIGIEWFQLHAGITRPILECCPDLEIPYLEVGWFRALQTFLLCSINAKLHLEMGRVPQILRVNYHGLMESFLDLQKYTWHELYRLNL
jgi:hypothetical protein